MYIRPRRQTQRHPLCLKNGQHESHALRDTTADERWRNHGAASASPESRPRLFRRCALGPTGTARCRAHARSRCLRREGVRVLRNAALPRPIFRVVFFLVAESFVSPSVGGTGRATCPSLWMRRVTAVEWSPPVPRARQSDECASLLPATPSLVTPGVRNFDFITNLRRSASYMINPASGSAPARSEQGRPYMCHLERRAR
jgi:hypothetical protein